MTMSGSEPARYLQPTLWNAVLLIDEADIFREKRTPRDIERNALVAIFLRRLEYYQGVLFLSGRLPSFYQKQLAQEAVAGLAGVAQVINETEVVLASS